jgi:predicted anti-sigma-YlaC factor YlaD
VGLPLFRRAYSAAPRGFRCIGRAHAPIMLLALLGGCSIQRYAISSVGDILASGDSVYETDNDPELIEEALPFGLKLIESLLAEQPKHRGLLLAAARGYLLYSYAFVAIPAEQARLDDLQRAQALRQRSRNLYLRAHSYASRALALDYPNIESALREDPAEALMSVDMPERDVPALYWSAAALGLAISASRNEPALLARLSEVEGMLQRALVLDEAWNAGTLHEFAINLAGAGSTSADSTVLADHYERALELADGARAGVHVTFAEVVAVPEQDRERFVELLGRALAIDVDEYPQQRLLNVVAQRRARWLLDNIDELFLE